MKNFTRSLLAFCLSMLMILQTKAQFGNALSYDPANTQFTTMPSGIVSTIPNGTSFTIEAWVFWKGGAAYQRIFDFGTSANDGYMYLTPSNGANVAFGFKIPDNPVGTSHPERQISGGSFPVNAWTHVAVVVDYSQVDIFGHGPLGFLYVNGSLVNPGGGGLYDGGAVGTPAYYPSALGGTETNWLGHPRSIFDPYFNGIIDELRISNTVRYSGATYTVPTAPFTNDVNTLALYHFNEGTGQTSVDATATNAAAILGPTTAVESADPSWILSTLPLKLTHFSAQKASNAVNLKWQASTTTEQGQFIVERSSDGSHFQSIGSVAISKTGGTFDYSFTDHSFNSNKNYYRLQIQEDNGAPKYSNILFVNMLVDYSLYPTLATDRVYVSIPKATNLSFYNSAGVLVRRMNLVSSQEVNINTLAKGVYYLRFESSQQTIRFTKM